MQTDIDKLEEYIPGLTAPQLQSFQKYYNTLSHFNSKINLVSNATLPNAARQHFADSALGIRVIMEHAKLSGTVYDFGSGNGFPGLVLAILRDDLMVKLVERDVRKAEFMKHIAGDLNLKHVTVLNQGIEQLDKSSVTQGITRALGSLSTVLIQMNSLFASGGQLFHFKADNWSSEIASCPTQVFTNWDIQPVGQYILPASSIDRFIISSVKK